MVGTLRCAHLGQKSHCPLRVKAWGAPILHLLNAEGNPFFFFLDYIQMETLSIKRLVQGLKDIGRPWGYLFPVLSPDGM